MPKITEYRGVENLIAAEVLTDDNELNGGYKTGTPFSIAGVAEISRTTETSNEPHYYDNVPAIIVSSTGSDEVKCTVSAIDIEVLAKITGQDYDETTGAMIDGESTPRYFALGYIAQKTDGTEVYVWRFKGQFSIPDSKHSTKTDKTDGEGQEITYTGISTTHKFTKNGKPAKAINVDLGKDLADVSTFFTKVTTPDDLKAKTVSPSTITG